jgi:hypothetical protein
MPDNNSEDEIGYYSVSESKMKELMRLASDILFAKVLFNGDFQSMQNQYYGLTTIKSRQIVNWCQQYLGKMVEGGE